MLETVDQSDFEEKVLNSGKPILLSYLNRDHAYEQNLAHLSSLAWKFKGRVRMLLFSYDCFFLCRKFCIMGSPSFIAFKDGQEISQLRGRVMFEDLVELCDMMLAYK